MKKYDELVKKVEMFEKLATYGNRREFLQSIAQTPKVQITDPKAPNYQDPRFMTDSQKLYWQEQAAKNVKPFNAQELDQWAAGLGRPKPPGAPSLDNVPQWQKDWASAPTPTASHDAAEQAYWDEKAKAPHPATSVPTTPGTTAPAARKPVSMKSDPAVHKAQLQLINNEGIGVGPSGADGKLGPDTLAALQKYKAKIGVPSLSNAEAIKALSDSYKAPAATPTGDGVYDPKLGF